MHKLKRLVRIVAGLLVLGICATVRADITLQWQVVYLSGSASADTLNANGWFGVRITAVADADSIAVAGFDLDSHGYGITGPAVHQQWTLTDRKHTGTWTQAIPSPTGDIPSGSSSDVVDSFFGSFPTFTPAVPLQEDSNMTGGTGGVNPNPPYDHSPLSNGTFANGAFLGGGPGSPDPDNVTALNSGVGTRLHGAGMFGAGAMPVQPLAYVIFPTIGGTRLVTFSGDVFDGTPDARVYHFDQYAYYEPEPASFVFLALAPLFLLRTRRRSFG